MRRRPSGTRRQRRIRRRSSEPASVAEARLRRASELSGSRTELLGRVIASGRRGRLRRRRRARPTLRAPIPAWRSHARDDHYSMGVERALAGGLGERLSTEPARLAAARSRDPARRPGEQIERAPERVRRGRRLIHRHGGPLRCQPTPVRPRPAPSRRAPDVIRPRRDRNRRCVILSRCGLLPSHATPIAAGGDGVPMDRLPTDARHLNVRMGRERPLWRRGVAPPRKPAERSPRNLDRSACAPALMQRSTTFAGRQLPFSRRRGHPAKRASSPSDRTFRRTRRSSLQCRRSSLQYQCGQLEP